MADGWEEPTHWKTLWCWKRLGQEKGTVEDKMFGWYHWPNGFEFEQALGEGEGQEGMICCSPWDYKELGWLTEQQITTSNNKATECIWPWVVSGALEACHRSETLDSGKTLDVFDWELVKQPLKCVTALKQWMSITYMVYLMWSEWRTTWNVFHGWNTICTHFRWSVFDLV